MTHSASVSLDLLRSQLSSSGRGVAMLQHGPESNRIQLPDGATDLVSPLTPVQDVSGRPLKDLRISVTDRCNFRCSYCMPRHVFDANHQFLPQSQLLSFEEITRAAKIFIGLGVEKIRLTGGEPLLRKNIEHLIAQLSQLRLSHGAPPELTLTTNGSILGRKAQALKDAGLQRITISLDAIDDTIFRRMNDADFPVRDVLTGIDAALAAGLSPIKVNMVVQKGVNEGQIVPMAKHFRGTGVELRFIEFMDVGMTNGWDMSQVIPTSQVQQILQEHFPIRAVSSARSGQTAERWTYEDGMGDIGFISSVTKAFCQSCTRLRLSTDGQLFTCLFAHQGHDLKTLLRNATPDSLISQGLATLWNRREDRYSELRTQGAAPNHRIEMSYIGG